MRVSYKVSCLALFLGLAPSMASALGLGEITVHSKLNQPFKADIAVLGLDGLTPDQVKLQVADNDAFAKAGLERPIYLNQLQFTWHKQQNGQQQLTVSSQRSIKDPYISFLVEAMWPDGQMIREYTVFLDPPMYKVADVAPVKRAEPKPAVKKPVQPAQKQAAAIEAKPVATAAVSPMAESRSVSEPEAKQPAKPATTIRTQSGDTLWQIAEAASQEQQVAVAQMLQAIVDHNPHAFYQGDASRLYAGAKLTIPQLAMPTAEMEQDMGHERVVADKSQQTADRLQLVVPKMASAEVETPAIDASYELKQDLLIAREALETRQRENEVLREELQLVSKQVASLKALLEIKKSELDQMQNTPVSSPSLPSVNQQEVVSSSQEMPELPAPFIAVATETPIEKKAGPVLASDEAVDEDELPLRHLLLIGGGFLMLLLFVVYRQQKRQRQQLDATVTAPIGDPELLSPETSAAAHEAVDDADEADEVEEIELQAAVDVAPEEADLEASEDIVLESHDDETEEQITNQSNSDKGSKHVGN